VVIVQENRTPDNLFGSAPPQALCNGQADFEPGVNIQDWGYINGTSHQCFVSRPLANVVNPGHQHADFKTMWHVGKHGRVQQ
jgi:hypothetical protein